MSSKFINTLNRFCRSNDICSESIKLIDEYLRLYFNSLKTKENPELKVLKKKILSIETRLRHIIFKDGINKCFESKNA